MSILITCCLGDHIKSNVDAIKEAFPDERIVGIDVRKMHFNHNGVDAFHQVCKCTDEGYVDAVLDVCKEEDVDLILSFSSLDIKPFKLKKKLFDDRNIRIALGLKEENLTEQANDKQWFCLMAKNHGIKVVETGEYLVYDNVDVKMFADRIGVDKVVIKQVDSTGAKGMEILDRSVFAACKFAFLKGAVIQKFLPGKEYSVDCFCKDGKMLFGCTKLNYEMDLGVSIYSEIVDRPDIVALCERACEVFVLDGLVGFDLKEDENGDVFILECNPRPTATISLVKHAGVNLLRHLIEYYDTGDTCFFGEHVRPGAKIARFREDYLF